MFAANGGPLAQMIGGVALGGIGNPVTGGSFIQGAAQGFITAAMNHAAHDIEFLLTKDKLIKLAKKEGICTAKDIGEYFEDIVEAGLEKEDFNVTNG